MIEKPPSTGMIDLDAAVSWALLIGLPLWGGLASFVRKMREGHVRPFNITELIGELTVSGFTGVIVANICDATPACPTSLKYAIVGITAHMGSRALFRLESVVNSKLNLPAEPAPAKESDNAPQ